MFLASKLSIERFQYDDCALRSQEWVIDWRRSRQMSIRTTSSSDAESTLVFQCVIFKKTEKKTHYLGMIVLIIIFYLPTFTFLSVLLRLGFSNFSVRLKKKSGHLLIDLGTVQTSSSSSSNENTGTLARIT